MEKSKLNNHLSAILQTIYHHQFSFSNCTTGNDTLADICNYSKDKIAVSTLSPSCYYSTENMLPEKAGAVEASSLPPVTYTTKCKVGDVLISNIRPYFKKIVYCQAECGCSNDVLCFTPNTIDLSAFLYCTLYSDQFFDFMVAGSKGTKMPRGDKQQIMTYSLYKPSNDELRAFNQIAFPILSKIDRNRYENATLSSFRDRLLPKLMSGELDVSDIDF